MFDACAMAALVDATPSAVADMSFRAPPNAPNGVLFAATMNMLPAPDMIGVFRYVVNLFICSYRFDST